MKSLAYATEAQVLWKLGLAAAEEGAGDFYTTTFIGYAILEADRLVDEYDNSGASANLKADIANKVAARMLRMVEKNYTIFGVQDQENINVYDVDMRACITPAEIKRLRQSAQFVTASS